MRTNKKLALTLGFAAGAVVAVLVSGRNGKKNKSYVGLHSPQPGFKLISERYDDSEVYYI